MTTTNSIFDSIRTQTPRGFPYLTATELADACGVCLVTVQRDIRAGRLNAVQLSKNDPRGRPLMHLIPLEEAATYVTARGPELPTTTT